MLRIVLIQIALFATPFLVWALYVLAVRRRRAVSGGVFDDAPIAWLIVSGIILAAASLFFLAVSTGSEPGGSYVPPRYEDGRIVPGHVE